MYNTNAVPPGQRRLATSALGTERTLVASTTCLALRCINQREAGQFIAPDRLLRKGYHDYAIFD